MEQNNMEVTDNELNDVAGGTPGYLKYTKRPARPNASDI